MTRQLLLLLHLLGAMAWIGGMFFAYFCLRPAAAQVLEPASRLPLWAATFDRFLRYTAVAIAIVLACGLGMLLQTGLSQAPLGWHVMLLLGVVMTAVFGYVYLALYPKLRQRCAAAEWKSAGAVLNDIRRLVAVNLVLGLCTVIAAVSAR